MSASAALASGWSLESAPFPAGASDGNLHGVSCSSPGACAAVGSLFVSASSVLAEGWDGASWSLQSVPSPTGSRSGLDAVSCTSRNACTAIGTAYSLSGISSVSVALAEHWNGARWSMQPSATVQDASLMGLSCASPRFCVAVGSKASRSNPVLIERWNGIKWSTQRTPSIPNPLYLAGVSCSAPSACTAVGDYAQFGGPQGGGALVERWNGRRWSIEQTAKPSRATGWWLHAVSCASKSACTAAGGYNTDARSGLMLVERWNGTSWSIQRPVSPAGAASGSPGSSSLSGVSCPSGTACTAVGGYYDAARLHQLSLAERWNGVRWSIQRTPTPAGATGSVLSGVSCSRVSLCTAVGSINGQLPLVERWGSAR